MRVISARRLLTLVISLCFAMQAGGQFYNGMQMSFGKNRVQYYDYYWSYYRFDDIDCYFNENGRALAQYTADYALKKLEEIEDYFDYTLEKRLILVIHNKQAESKQSNIGNITFSDDDYNVGGYSRIIKNKVILYYEGDHIAYQKQIAQSIAEAIINEIVTGAEMRDRVSSSSQFAMPDWYLKGLINYVAFGWDYTAENIVKDGFTSGKWKRISHLEYDNAVYAGQSFWRFLGKEYGDALIPNIIYLSKIYKNISDGFLYVVGQPLNDLLKEWQAYYREEFTGGGWNPSKEPGTLKRSKKDQIIQQVKISPDNRYIAYVTNHWGRKKIILYDNQTAKSKIVFRTDPKYEHRTDNTYPVIAWHPNGRILTFINEQQANLRLYFYRIDEHKSEDRLLLYFDKVLDFSYSADGTRFVFSAVKDGITDIYIHTIASGTNDQITRDVADDLHPSFLRSDPGKILFSSNRLSDTLVNNADPFGMTGLSFDLFIYDLNRRENVLTRLSEEQYTDRFQAISTGKSSLSYLSNQNGVFNRFEAVLDSTISFIDTTTHYRKFIRSRPATDYKRNILYSDVTPASTTTGEVIYSAGRHFTRKKTAEPADLGEKDLSLTAFRKEHVKLLQRADSIEKLRQRLLIEDKKRRDTLTKPVYEYYVKDEPVDINYYIFEKEKENYYEQQWRKDYMDIDLDTSRLQLPLIRIYEPSFYNNYVANQIDFSFLNNSYQPYSGGAPYFNPGMNLMTRIGTLDLFEDYRITGGFRFAFDFDSYEYMISVENLKGKFDKQLLYHRQFFQSYSNNALYNISSDNVYLSASKPLSPVLALKGTLSYRLDRYIALSTDAPSLSAPNITRNWANLKGEVIYDNTRKRNINIFYGTRFKLFGEYYREIPGNRTDMVILGADFRHYLKIHRELIWANRFAASSSFGPTRLLYYLGGVDNWMGYYFENVEMFDNSIPVSNKYNWGFQALATNLRGFSQNVRNGNSFALINSELRWPFVLYFAGHPLRSKFLNSLQLVGFGDVGTAWTGKSPWAGDNAYDSQVIRNGPVVVTLDSNRNPIVGGVGGGLRALLFGYFIRADLAWGIDNGYIQPSMFYLSFSLDF